MSSAAHPPIEVTPIWARLNDELIRLVDYIPDDKLEWSPKPELWNLRGILLHVCMARHNWLGNTIKDGEQPPDVLRDGQTREGMKEQLSLSWQRLGHFLSDAAKVSAEYTGLDPRGQPYRLSGHWIAYHLLEHDIHHRADIFHYLALLGIEHPEVGTP